MTTGLKALFTTPINEMTVADSFKLNGIVIATIGVCASVPLAASIAHHKFDDWNGKRQFRKLEESLPLASVPD